MKRISIRIRYTIVASLFLLISCITLTFLSNMSAGRMIDAATVAPAISSPENQVSAIPIEEPADRYSPYYRTFQRESILATVIIVLLGSMATYFASGYVLKPIRILSKEVKRRNINNLGEPLDLPQTSDEIQELTVSFNQMMAELQNAFALQKQFSANAAHELRTPLAVMQAKLDVFSLETPESTAESELIYSLNKQLERLSQLIEDLLWFSKDLPLDKTEPVPLYPLLCDVAEELSSLSQEKYISVCIDETSAVLQGQDSLLERVFYNLLENAIKYSPAHTMVSIMTKKENDFLKVCVCDQGEGIPEKYRTVIFEPFFRIDKSRSRAIGGSGLGLAVCKKILERHHAAICVKPNHPTGSIFEIQFPS